VNFTEYWADLEHLGMDYVQGQSLLLWLALPGGPQAGYGCGCAAAALATLMVVVGGWGMMHPFMTSVLQVLYACDVLETFVEHPAVACHAPVSHCCCCGCC
jgi:hypothetical protein